MTVDGGLVQGGSWGGWGMRVASGLILKLEPVEFASGLDVERERKGRTKDGSKDLFSWGSLGDQVGFGFGVLSGDASWTLKGRCSVESLASGS